MPYKNQTDKIKLPRSKDRRVKITHEMKLDIIDKMLHWWTQTDTAEFHWISRWAVRFIMDPEALQRHKEASKERRKDWRYYDPLKHKLAIRDTRRYRQKVLTNS